MSIYWKTFEGLGINRQKNDRQPLKVKTRKFKKRVYWTKEQRKADWLKRSTEKMSKGIWVKEKAFFAVHDIYLKSEKWLKFRKKIILRSSGFCEYCFKKTKNFHVHHLTYANWGKELEEDVMALCAQCHKEIHS